MSPRRLISIATDVAVGVPGHDVDRADGRRVLASDEGPALAHRLDVLSQQLLQMRLDAVLLQARVDAELVLGVVQHLVDRDDEFVAGFRVRDGPRPDAVVIGLDRRATWGAHPVQGLVRAVVGVNGDRAVGLHQDQPVRHREVGAEASGVVDRAAGDHEAHDSEI